MSQQRIVGFHLDSEEHWVAQLACGHTQHVRHNPPWQLREWVLTQSERQQKIGMFLPCVKCDRDEPADGEWGLGPEAKKSLISYLTGTCLELQTTLYPSDA